MIRLHLISKKEYLPSYEDYINQQAEPKPFQPNGERIHDYLKEMTDEVFSQYDVMSVGEVGSVTPEEGLKYTGTDKHGEYDFSLSAYGALISSPEKNIGI